MFPIDINKEGKKRMRKCKQCGEETNNIKFCSRACMYAHRKKQRIKINCLQCKKIRYIVFSLKNAKFCSNDCKFKYWKKHKIGAFCNPKIKLLNASIAGKNSAITNKKNGTGIYGLTLEERQKNAKKANITNKKNKTGLYGLTLKERQKNAKKANITNKLNKTGFCYDKKVRGMITKILRDKKGYVFNNINFDSKSEMEFGMNIHYQIEKLKENKNYSIPIGFFTCDFYIKKYNCFIEYHPYNSLYDKDDTNLKKYYKRRRKNLNVNGSEGANLLIIK